MNILLANCMSSQRPQASAGQQLTGPLDAKIAGQVPLG